MKILVCPEDDLHLQRLRDGDGVHEPLDGARIVLQWDLVHHGDAISPPSYFLPLGATF